MSKKFWVKNSSKRWGFVKIEFLDKNVTFRLVCKMRPMRLWNTGLFIEGWKALSHTKVLTYPRFYFNATCDENVIICIAKLFESSQTKSVSKEKSLAAALQGRGKIHLIYIIYSLKLLSVLYYTPLGSCKVSLKGPLSTQKQSSLLLPPFAFFLKKSTRNPSIHFFFFFPFPPQKSNLSKIS